MTVISNGNTLVKPGGFLKKNDWENHQKACKEALESLGWVTMEVGTVDYVESFIGGSDMWANKVRVAHKGNDAQKAFCDDLKALLVNLKEYVKAHHKTGLPWNPKGGEVATYDENSTLAVAAPSNAEAATGPGTEGAQPGGGSSPSLAAFDAYVAQTMGPFQEACAALSGDLSGSASAVQAGWNAVREFLVMAGECSKPDNMQDLVPKLGGIQEALKSADSAITRGDWENHQKAVKEALGSMGWVTYPDPAMSDFMDSIIGSSDFWANKVRVQHKGDADQTQFCNTLKALLTGLKAFIKDHHTAGLKWNPSGGQVSAYEAGSKPPPPPPPAAAAAAPGAGAGGGASFLAQLNKGGGITSGLKKVARDQQTWRAEYKGGSGPAPAAAAAAAAKAPAQPRPPAKPAAAPVSRPPRCELNNRSKKWEVEFQTEAQGVVNVEVTDIKQSVYIYKCDGATINITGKAKGVSVDGSKKCKVLCDSVVSSIEVFNSQRLQVQVREQVPSIAIDKCDGILVYLSKESMGASFTTSKSSEMNVSFPDENGEMVEVPLPEQFVHRLSPGPNPSVSSEVSDLYSS